jgi:hypothetical protein
MDNLKYGRKYSMEILNTYVSFPFDKEEDEDLFDEYSSFSLLISQVDVSPIEPLKKDCIYHIVITRTSGD